MRCSSVLIVATLFVPAIAIAESAPEQPAAAQSSEAEQAVASAEPERAEADPIERPNSSSTEPPTPSHEAPTEPEAASEPSWDAWTFSVGIGIVAHGNAASVMVPMPGASLSLSRMISPWIGVRASYGLHYSRRGVSGTWTLQLHHYAGAQLLLRHAVHRRCALWLGAGAALVVQQNGHHAPANSVWVAQYAPAVALSGGVDLTLPGFGVRFSIDAYLHPDFADLGGGVHALVPFG